MKVLLSELSSFAKEVAARLPASAGSRAFVLFLEGDLGAGKTTFMQHFAHALGIGEPIQSPTFVLMKTHMLGKGSTLDSLGAKVEPWFTKLVHIDAYRLEGAHEFEPLKPEQFLNDPQAIVCIEWPEKVSGALPPPDLVLQFSHMEGETEARDIQIKTNDRGQA